jgi:putative transposase
VLDALEQALYDRKHSEKDGLIHFSDRGSQYLSIRYNKRLAEAGTSPHWAPKKAMTTPWPRPLGLYKAEIIHRRGPWETKQTVELATLNGFLGSTTIN